MENNQRNSRKRLNSLILLVAFTAVMLIVSTYAWFSTQRNVTFNSIKGAVNVAEGLQVSLDGQTWVNTINFADFDQSQATWPLKTGATSNYFAAGVTGASLATPRGTADATVTNVIPTEFLPVSTDGKIETDATGITMYGGNLEGNNTLKSITTKTEASASGYFAFDIFLMNTSGTSTENDTLNLDANSTVTAGNTNSGAQNTARVGFAVYQNKGQGTAEAANANVAGTLTGVTGIASDNGSAVVTATTGAVRQIAIWEPNADKHTSTIVGKFNNRLIKTAGTPNPTAYYTVKDGTTGTESDPHTPTYGLTAASTTAGTPAGTITNIYDWDTTNGTNTTTVALQNTVKTKAGALADNKTALVSAADGSSKIEIGPNQYHKIRIYIWMEGQDVDCLNEASFGKDLTIDLGINKPEITQGT